MQTGAAVKALWFPEVLLNAIGGRGAKPGFGRGHGRRLSLAETHVQPRLAIGDVAAGQAVVPHRREEPASYPAGRDRQPTRPFAGPRRSPDSPRQSGYALLPSRTRRHFLILIDAPSHLDRRAAAAGPARKLVHASRNRGAGNARRTQLASAVSRICTHCSCGHPVSSKASSSTPRSAGQQASRPAPRQVPRSVLALI